MGFGIEGDITKIYDNYMKKHPECSVLSGDAVWLRMKEEGVITQAQYNTYKNGLIFDFSSQSTSGSWKSTFGLETTPQTKKPANPNNTKLSKYHPVYKDLLLDSKGKIDMNQFSLEALKQKYPADKYTIVRKKSDDAFSYEKSEIQVKDKAGKTVLNISDNSDGTISYTSYKNGKEFNFYNIKNGIVIFGRHTEANGKYTQYKYADDGKTIKSITIGDKNGYIEKTYENGELVEIFKNNLETNRAEFMKYKHGVLISTTVSNDENQDNEYNNVVSMMNNIFERDKYGYLKIHAGNARDLIKVLDKDNIEQFLSEYKKKYNREFTTYLASIGYENSNKDKEKLLKHIRNCLLKANKYNPYKKITNDRISNDNYSSKNVYDVQYRDNVVIIYNKTTGKQSKLLLNRLLSQIKDPAEKAVHKINIQNLPAEILEIYANEGIILRNDSKLDSAESKVGGYYKNSEETIYLPYYTDNYIYIHEVLHAVDYDNKGNTESMKGKLEEAFELGLKRYEAAGFHRFKNIGESDNDDQNDKFYFSKNAKECWARIGEMLFNGTCEGQEILKQFWPEFIELEKATIAKIQSKPAIERHS